MVGSGIWSFNKLRFKPANQNRNIGSGGLGVGFKVFGFRVRALCLGLRV
jgi:hypothetical protein